jgi:hypothetical protein
MWPELGLRGTVILVDHSRDDGGTKNTYRRKVTAQSTWKKSHANIVAVEGGGLASAQAAQGDQPPQRGEPVVLHPDEEGDQLPQRPERDRRADAVAARQH